MRTDPIKLTIDKMEEVLEKFPADVKGFETVLKLVSRYCIEISKKTNATSIDVNVEEITDNETGENMGSVKLEWVLDNKDNQCD